jgi:transcriptional regulator with XRE-family HTH domain
MSKRSDYLPTKTYADLTPGQALRIMRELQGMTQVDLAQASGVTQTAISALERDRETLGIERAKNLALALHIHPAVLVFPALAPPSSTLPPSPPKPPSKKKELPTKRGATKKLLLASGEDESESSSNQPSSSVRARRGGMPRRKIA